jgi:hypothetical protein
MIALEHIVRAEFTDAYPGGEEKYDEDYGKTFTTTPRKASLKLTLTTQHLETHIDDFSSGYYVAAASENDLVTLRGAEAVELLTYLENTAVIVNLEAAQLDRLVKVPAEE